MPTATTFEVNKQKLEVRLARVIQATPERIWQAITDPEQIAQWWGPSEYKIRIVEHDPRIGGRWRYIHISGKNEFAFHGVYKLLDKPNRVVRTFVYEGIQNAEEHELTETMTITDLGDGRTRIEAVSQYSRREDLEGMVASGMESGAVESFERLAELVEAG